MHRLASGPDKVAHIKLHMNTYEFLGAPRQAYLFLGPIPQVILCISTRSGTLRNTYDRLRNKLQEQIGLSRIT